MNPEIALILAIMNGSKGYSYGSEGDGKGSITDFASNKKYDVDAINYERANIIHRVMTMPEDDVYKVKVFVYTGAF